MPAPTCVSADCSPELCAAHFLGPELDYYLLRMQYSWHALPMASLGDTIHHVKPRWRRGSAGSKQTLWQTGCKHRHAWMSTPRSPSRQPLVPASGGMRPGSMAMAPMPGATPIGPLPGRGSRPGRGAVPAEAAGPGSAAGRVTTAAGRQPSHSLECMSMRGSMDGHTARGCRVQGTGCQ